MLQKRREKGERGGENCYAMSSEKSYYMSRCESDSIDISPTWESICWPNNSRLFKCIFDSKMNLNYLKCYNFVRYLFWKHCNFVSWLGFLNCILTCLVLCKSCYDCLCDGKASSHNKNQLSRAAVSRLSVILPISMSCFSSLYWLVVDNTVKRNWASTLKRDALLSLCKLAAAHSLHACHLSWWACLSCILISAAPMRPEAA